MVLLWTNPDVDVLSFESFFVSLHCWNGFGGSYYFFQKLPKISSQHFFILNNTPGNASGKGQSPVERPHSTPSPTPNHNSTANIVTFGLPCAHHTNVKGKPKANQKNRPFGLKEPSLWFVG
ncbi:MAG: hypothetical protein L6U16_06895 [Porphyromonadaceae bacterium]|nr:MAG: hypothetical protein L6U16_06895 [Porphyromonadaceae bacterium]